MEAINNFIARNVFDGVVTAVVNEIVANQVNAIGFRDVAYPMLLADARAGVRMPIFRGFVRAFLPITTFQLLRREERDNYPDEDLQNSGQFCMACFKPIDALDPTVASFICCGTDNTIACDACRPGVMESHRLGIMTHHPLEPGGPPPPPRLSGNWHVVQNLIRSRAEFNDI
jgi:hypothetical protein